MSTCLGGILAGHSLSAQMAYLRTMAPRVPTHILLVASLAGRGQAAELGCSLPANLGAFIEGPTSWNQHAFSEVLPSASQACIAGAILPYGSVCYVQCKNNYRPVLGGVSTYTCRLETRSLAAATLECVSLLDFKCPLPTVSASGVVSAEYDGCTPGTDQDRPQTSGMAGARMSLPASHPQPQSIAELEAAAAALPAAAAAAAAAAAPPDRGAGLRALVKDSDQVRVAEGTAGLLACVTARVGPGGDGEGASPSPGADVAG